MKQIQEAIDSIVPLTGTEWSCLQTFMEEKILRKNEFLLQQGHVCTSVAFVVSGSLIYSRLLTNGTEVTTDFAFEGDWVTDNRSRLNNAPSLLNIKALHKTDLLVIKQSHLMECFRLIPKLEKLGRILMEQAFIKIAQQSTDLQTLTARERYNKMLADYPEIFQRVPLYHIANYLGIAPKSLSRLRKG